MKRSAFTLVELLIVISIIAVVVALVMIDFRGAVQRQQLSVAGQQALAMMQQARASVQAGLVDEELQCVGGRFELNEPFVALSGAYTDGCEVDNVDSYGSQSALVYVQSAEVGESEVQRLDALFVPPGTLEFYEDGAELSNAARVTLAHRRNAELTLTLVLAPLNDLLILDED